MTPDLCVYVHLVCVCFLLCKLSIFRWLQNQRPLQKWLAVAKKTIRIEYAKVGKRKYVVKTLIILFDRENKEKRWFFNLSFRANRIDGREGIVFILNEQQKCHFNRIANLMGCCHMHHVHSALTKSFKCQRFIHALMSILFFFLSSLFVGKGSDPIV